MKYFVRLGEDMTGPLSAGQMRLRIVERGLAPSSLVRREDKDEWLPLSTLAEFADDGGSVPLPNPMAALSLILGILSVILLITEKPILSTPRFCLAGILAIVFGHLALRKIARSIREVSGYPMARGSLWLGYFIGIIFPVGFAISHQGICRLSIKGNISKAISNCRQITTTLRLYSSDNQGKYPDSVLPQARTSNAAFHKMFVDGQADNEGIFGCPESLYQPDGYIGVGPDFSEALQPGENHWAMTKGLNDSMSGNIPLVYENTFVPAWPPRWNADRANAAKPGRTWSGGKIIIGFNDSSVILMHLESSTGQHVGLKKVGGFRCSRKWNPDLRSWKWRIGKLRQKESQHRIPSIKPRHEILHQDR